MSSYETRTIDGLEVRATKLPVMTKAPIALMLLQTIGPVLVPIAMEGAKGADEVSPAMIGAALTQVPPGTDIKALLRSVFLGVSVTRDDKVVELSNDALINAAFGDNFATMLKAAQFAIEVNFGGFFGGSPATSGGAGPA